jgi:hypothetical protein
MVVTSMTADGNDGIRQGSILNPLFFNIYIEGVITEWQERIGVLLLTLSVRWGFKL